MADRSPFYMPPYGPQGSPAPILVNKVTPSTFSASFL